MSNNKGISSKPMRGMRDILPINVELRQSVISKIEKVYINYGFSKIETPAVERINLLTTGEGGDNEKQVFGILKRGITIDDVKKTKSIGNLIDGGLRFDLTVPLARYFANNQANIPIPFKTFQIGDVWRAERPQRGRHRQFVQCDIDIIGDETDFAEKELILATSEVLVELGFNGFRVRINDRRILKGVVEYCGYNESIYDKIFIIIDKFDKIGLDGIEKELSKKGFDKFPSEKLMNFLNLVSVNPRNLDLFSILPKNVDSDVIDGIKNIISSVKMQSGNNYQIVFDPMLVRGMGYYTGPIFEIEDKDFPISIAGGGRYDKMIGKYSSKDMPACGFSIGFERIMVLLEDRSLSSIIEKQKKVLLFDSKFVGMDFVLDKAKKLRDGGAVIYTQQCRKNITRQLGGLATLGYCSFCLIRSELDEIKFRSLK